jgi:hypothetical protein
MVVPTMWLAFRQTSQTPAAYFAAAPNSSPGGSDDANALSELNLRVITS